jgi:predicted  nucleic acid-binding Zn-ribbon protein
VNILTKIFIVVMVPLTIVAGIVFSAQAVINPSYRALYEEQMDLKAAAEADSAASSVALSVAEFEVIERGQQLTEAKAAFEIDNQKLRLANETLMNRLTANDRDLQELNVKVTALETHLSGVKSERDVLNEQRDALRQMVEERDAELAGLNGVLRECEQDIDTLERLIRVLQEQIAEQEDQLALYSNLPTDQAGTVTAEPVAPQPTATIRGGVTAVDLDNNLVQINVGTIQGVRREMEFFIFRGDQFIAKLRVLEVDDGEATGLLFDRKNDLSPVAGDQVATSMR